MDGQKRNSERPNPPPIYIVSGGGGASGEQLVRTILAQFPDNQLPVKIVSRVRQVGQIENVVAKAAASGGSIVYTLVDDHLQDVLNRVAAEQNVVAFDLMGDLLSYLSRVLGREPVRQPGLYQHLHRAYFERIKAIEFAVAHDDGGRVDDWPLAEIVLLGASRVGKTPLSVYLSVLGWRVANVPLILNIPPSPKLFDLDHRRVIGLDIAPGQLVSHRQQRQRRLRIPGASAYVDPPKIYEELEAARQIFRQGGFTTIDVTDKPIEVTADEITNLIIRRFEPKDDKSPVPL